MVSKGEVSNDFRKQVLGYGLTTAEIVTDIRIVTGCYKHTFGRTTICFPTFRR
jgi:hypothetical protein